MASRGRIDKLFRTSSTSKIMKKPSIPQRDTQETQVVDADLTRALKQIFEVRQLNGTQNTSTQSSGSSCKTEEPSLTLFGRKLNSPTSPDACESKNAQLPPAATAHLLKELHKQRLKQKGITATGNEFPDLGEIEFVHTERKPEVSTLPLLNFLQEKRPCEDWIQNGVEKRQRLERDLNLSLSIKLGPTDESNDTKEMEIDKSPVVKNPEQLTLFYNGQVLVYDDVPSDKAKAIMVLASSISSKTSCYTPSSISSVKSTKSDLSATKKPVIEKAQTGSTDVQARKASIQRFLEKRKDRYIKNATQTETEKTEGTPSKEGSPLSAKPSKCGEENTERAAMTCEEQEITATASKTMQWIGV